MMVSVIRLAIPALTEERRKELVKQVKKEAEEAKVAIRNVRRDANEDFKKLEKSGEITEDDLHRNGEEIQKLTDSHILKKSMKLQKIKKMKSWKSDRRTFYIPGRPNFRTSFSLLRNNKVLGIW